MDRKQRCVANVQHDLTERQVADQLDRYVGQDWEQRYDLLAAMRDVEREVIADDPYGEFIEDDLAIPFWCGTRRTDERTSAAGYYRAVADSKVEFRPLISALKHEEAELLARLLYSEIGGDFVALRQLADGINDMNGAEREAFFADVRRIDFSPPERERTLDFHIDL